MKYFFSFLLTGILMAGCTYSNTPPFKFISEESKLPVAISDSVEYYDLSDRDIWDLGSRTPFRIILHFDDQAYKTILKQVEKESSYSELPDKKQKQKVYNIFFKKNISPPPKCSMDQPMYVYHAKKSGTTVFCNRIYFRTFRATPFD